MALGKPRSTGLSAIRRRWAGTVKQSFGTSFSYERPEHRPTAWHQVLTGAPLPSAEQAAMDVNALLNRVEEAERQMAMRTDEMEAFYAVLQIMGPFTDY